MWRGPVMNGIHGGAVCFLVFLEILPAGLGISPAPMLLLQQGGPRCRVAAIFDAHPSTLHQMIAIAVLLVFVVLIAFYAIGIYNRLVKLKNLVAEAWSGIDVQLKK